LTCWAKNITCRTSGRRFLSKVERVRVALVEIADKFVNKITTYVQEGQSVKPAQKLSFIERG
jgi:phosphatidylserine decarboxylase